MFSFTVELSRLKTSQKVIQKYTEKMGERFFPAQFVFIEGTAPEEVHCFPVGNSDRVFGYIVLSMADHLTDEDMILLKGSIDVLAVFLERFELQSRLLRKKKMLSNIGDVIVIIDSQGLNQYKSPNIQRLFGWSPGELIGNSAFDLVHPDDVQRAKEFFSEIISVPGNHGRTELQYRCKNGLYRAIQFTAVNLLLDPDICGILGNYHDISQRKAAEEELRASETRFKSLHNASFGGIAIHDKGRILECNHGLSVMFGYSIDELVGMDGLLLISEDSREYVMSRIQDGYEKPYEAKGLRKDGSVFPMRLEARNVPYKGRAVRTVEFRDITQQKTDEEERKNLQAQLHQAQKMESVGRLAGGVAHDFNNMLGVILGHLELLQEEFSGRGDVSDSLSEIRLAAERSVALTRQLLAFARKQVAVPRVLKLNAVVESLLKMIGRLIGEDITLEWNPGRDLWPLEMDPSQIDQILVNLCVNARDAISGTGRLTIKTENVSFEEKGIPGYETPVSGDFVLLSVSDDGCGMDAESLKNIFEPFYTTKEVGRGTGLGMSTVYGIVSQNDGYIHVYSEVSVGTVVKMYLPRYTRIVSSELPPAKQEDIQRGNETILLVEDDPAIRRMTKKMLERLGYTVTSSKSPDDAIQIVQAYEGDIDLILTDVIMPEMNGKELIEILRKTYPDLKHLFMSGYSSNVIANHGVLQKGVPFLEKPFSRKELSQKLREAISHKTKD